MVLLSGWGVDWTLFKEASFVGFRLRLGCVSFLFFFAIFFAGFW